MTPEPNTPPPAPQAGTPAASSPSAARWKLFLLIGGLLAAMALVYFTPLGTFLKETRTLGKRLHDMGWEGPALFVVATSLLVAIGVPRLGLCVLAGMAFGFWRGLLWAQLGTIIGSYGTFVFSRWAGQDFMLRHWPRLQKYDHLFVRGGVWTVVLAKQVPINGLWMNAILGMTRLNHTHYLIGMMIGIFPQAIPATLIGAGILAESSRKSAAVIGIGVLLFGLAVILLRYLARRGRAAAGETQPE